MTARPAIEIAIYPQFDWLLHDSLADSKLKDLSHPQITWLLREHFGGHPNKSRTGTAGGSSAEPVSVNSGACKEPWRPFHGCRCGCFLPCLQIVVRGGALQWCVWSLHAMEIIAEGLQTTNVGAPVRRVPVVTFCKTRKPHICKYMAWFHNSWFETFNSIWFLTTAL